MTEQFRLREDPTVASAINDFEAVPWEGRFIEDYPPGDQRNAYRASLALPALAAFCDRTGTGQASEPLGQVISDLLADLMHLCDLATEDGEEISFSYLADRAEHDYKEEVNGE
jgi:hypothetical protein